MLRRNYDFCIGAACYPEKHPEATTIEDDLRHLKLKAEAGADSWSRSSSSTIDISSSLRAERVPWESTYQCCQD